MCIRDRSIGNDFLNAGAKSVVNTLWSVNDKSTSLIMAYFYENLAKGQTKDIALQQAKIKYLQKHPELGSSPYYWGGIIAHGDMSSLQFTSKSGSASYTRVFLVSLFSFLLLVFLFLRNKKRKVSTK